MRHMKRGRKLNRNAEHRKALMANLATSVLEKGRITTTTAKAKEARGVVERLVTYAKRGSLHARRIAAKTVRNETALKKLFDQIGPDFKDRSGGYTRVLKLGRRRGDAAELAILELVGFVPKAKTKKKKEGGGGQTADAEKESSDT